MIAPRLFAVAPEACVEAVTQSLPRRALTAAGVLLT